MNKPIASNIDDAYRACNPDIPLKADDDRYVDLAESRGTKHFAKSITRNISRCEPNTQLKVLFTGHRGSGKTTELFRLKQELNDNQFFTIYMDIEEILDLGSLNYLDVLVAIAKEIQRTMQNENMPISEDLLNNISEWFSEKILEENRDTSHGVAVKRLDKI